MTNVVEGPICKSAPLIHLHCVRRTPAPVGGAGECRPEAVSFGSAENNKKATENSVARLCAGRHPFLSTESVQVVDVAV